MAENLAIEDPTVGLRFQSKLKSFWEREAELAVLNAEPIKPEE